jgi:hypothetical protein
VRRRRRGDQYGYVSDDDGDDADADADADPDADEDEELAEQRRPILDPPPRRSNGVFHDIDSDVDRRAPPADYSSGGDDSAGRALDALEARLPPAGADGGGRRRSEFGRIGREMAAARRQLQVEREMDERRGRADEVEDPADINGAYRDPGSPSARDRKRKSSWRFWRIG